MKILSKLGRGDLPGEVSKEGRKKKRRIFP